MVSTEIETFLHRCNEGETSEEAQAVISQPGGAPLVAYGNYPTFKLQVQGTSNFQRMLAYKVAEWYGIKAISGPSNAIFVGLIAPLLEKRYVTLCLVYFQISANILV